MFTLEAQKSLNESATTLATIHSDWSETPGHNVQPELGSSFLYTGHSRLYAIHGNLLVSLQLS